MRSRRTGLKPGKHGASPVGAAQFLRLAGRSGRAQRQSGEGDCRAENSPPPAKNIDVDDVNRLLDIDLNDPLAVRDRAMLEVMYGAGLRLSNWSALDIKHLDLESGEVWVMGKGSKERRLPIGRNAVAWIEHWLDLRGLFGTDDDALFLSKLGKRISARNVQKRFAEWGIKQGLNSHVHPHKLRHPLPPICWSRAAICAACRSCWGMLTSPPPKSIPILIFNTLLGVRCRASAR